MLPKENRLKKDKDFQEVYLKGKTYQSNFFIVKVLENNEKVSKFGFVISNKISKKSTKRNKLKRWLREIIRLNLANFKKGLNIVIFVKKNILNKEFNFIKENLVSFLKKDVKIFKK